MQHRRGEVGREAGQVLDQPAHAVVAERDLALELAQRRSGRSRAGRRCRPRACRCRAAARRSRRRRGRSPGTSRRSPRRTGRRSASARAARGGRPGGSAWRPARRGTAARSARSGPSTASSRARRCGFWTVASRSRRSASICSGPRGGPSSSAVQSGSSAGRSARTAMRAGLEVAAHVHGGARLAEGRQVVAHGRADRAGAVAEREPQLVAVPLAAAHQEDPVDLLPVGELAHHHGENVNWAAGWDRTAIITGGTGGLGRAVVAAFVANGWRVVVLDAAARRARGRRGGRGRPRRPGGGRRARSPPRRATRPRRCAPS